MNELIINQVEQLSNGIRIMRGSIAYDNFEQDMETALRIADEVMAMEPTEDNLKQAKAMLASARKVSDGVNRVRIDIKKRMMDPYDTFAEQVRQITAVIDTADAMVREKVNIIEEQHRQQKKADLLEIWNARCQWYTLPKALPNAFDMWLEPRHLNKTTTMKTCEAEMVSWLEKTSGELDTCHDMGPEYVDAYLRCLNLREAITSVNETTERRKALKEAQGEEHTAVAAFYVEGEKDIQLTEMLLDRNHIRYQKEDM